MHTPGHVRDVPAPMGNFVGTQLRQYSLLHGLSNSKQKFFYCTLKTFQNVYVYLYFSLGVIYFTYK